MVLGFRRFRLWRLFEWKRRRPADSSRSPARRRFRPAVEWLEDRLAPASIIDLGGGNLIYDAAPGVNNTVTLSRSGGNYTVASPGDNFTFLPGGWSGVGTPTATGPEGAVSAWTFNLGDGTNILNIGAAGSGSLIDSLTSVGTGTSDTFNVVAGGGGINVPGGAVSVTNYTAVNLNDLVNNLSNATFAASGPITTTAPIGATVISLTSSGGDISIGNGLTGSGSASITAAGNITFTSTASDVTTGATLDVHSGTDGSGNISFTAAGIVIQADNQTWRAGNGTGGVGGATADLVTNAPVFRDSSLAPAIRPNFTYRQDAAIGDGNLPAAAQFTAGLPLNYTIDSDDASISITTAGKVAGSNLTLQANTNIALPTMTGANQLMSLNATAGFDGVITLNGDITTTGAAGQVFNTSGPFGKTNLAANVILTGAANSPITFNGFLNASANQDLTVNTTGTTSFNNGVGLGGPTLGSLTTDAGGTTQISSDIATSGLQSYGDAIVLTGNAALTSTGGGNITFNSTISGAHDLTVNTAGTTRFNGRIGFAPDPPGPPLTPLTSLTTDAAGTTVFNNIPPPQSSANPGIEITGALTINDDFIVNGVVAIQAASVLFGSNVNGPGQMIIVVGGTLTFDGAVGGSTALFGLQVGGTGTTLIKGGLVRTSNLQFFARILLNSATNSTTLVSSGGASITLGSSSGDFVRSSTDGEESLTLNTTGSTIINAVVGDNSQRLSSLTTDAGGTTRLNADVTTIGGQTYNDDVVLTGNVTLTSTGGGAITFNSALNDDVAAPSRELVVTTSGNSNFQGEVGGTTPLRSLTTNGGGLTQLFQNVTTVGPSPRGQNYGDDVSLINSVVLNAGAGDVTFSGTISNAGPRNLTVTAGGTTTFTGVVGGGTALNTLTTNGGGLTRIGNNITTVGGMQFLEAVELFGNAVVNGGTGDVNFGMVDSDGTARNLTVTTSATTRFNAVGSSSSLNNLRTDGGGSTVLNGNVTTGGANPDGQSYLDNVVLGADVILDAGTGLVDFNGTVNDDGVGPASSLTVNAAGDTVFNNVVGGGAPLSSLTTGGGGVTRIQTGSITTNGAGGTVFNDAVRLTTDVVLTATSGAGTGVVTFGGIINSPTPRNLTINNDGVTTFNGTVGTNPLASLTTDAGGATVINTSQVNSTGAQTYNDDVMLGVNSTLTVTTATFNDSLDLGDRTLNVTGDFSLGAAATLLSNQTNGTTFGNVNVGGTVSLNDANLTVTRAAGFTPASGTSFTLINNGAGTPVNPPGFAGLAEGTTFLVGAIPETITYLGGGTNDVVLTVQAPTTVYVDDSWAGTAPGANPNFNPVASGLIFGYNAFADVQPGINQVAANGTLVIFGGLYSNPVNINKDIQPIQINVNSTLPTFPENAVTLNGAVTLTNNAHFSLTAFTPPASPVQAPAFLLVGGTIDSGAVARSLTLTGTPPNDPGATLGGAVGGSMPLSSITTLGGVAIGFDTSVTTTGNQTYNGFVGSNGGAVFTSSTGALIFNDVLGTFDDVTLTANAIDFNGGAATVTAGTLTLQPLTNTDSIGVDSALGTLQLSATDIAALDGSNQVVIGRAAGSGVINIGTAAAVVFNDPVRFRSSGGGGIITVSSQITGNDNAAIELDAGGGTVELSANLVTNGNAVELSGFAELDNTATVLIDTTNGGAAAAGADVTFNNGVGDDAVVPTALQVRAGTAGFVTFQGNVGTPFPLTSLTVVNANDVCFCSDVTTTGAQDITANTVELNGAHTTAGGAVTFNGAVTLANNVTVTTQAGAVSFNGTVDGSPDLTINSTSTTTFNGAVGSGVSLGALTTNAGGTTQINGGSVNTTGFAQTYNDDVTLGQAFTILAGIVNFNASLTLGATTATATSTLQIAGTLNFTNTTTLTTAFTSTGAGQVGNVLVGGGNTTYGNAMLVLNYSGGFTPAGGDTFDIVSNGGFGIGQFINAPAPGPVTINGTQYLVTYSGSDGGGDFILTAAEAPTFTSANQTTFAIGQLKSFLITTSGLPTAAITRTGTLPAGVTFVDLGNGTGRLRGTPAANTAGVYNLVFRADNGIAPDAVQNFRLTVTGTAGPIIAVGAGSGMQPWVKVYDGRTRRLQSSFLAYSAAFHGGVRVAVGDVNNDGFQDVITGAGAGAGPHVKVFSGRDGRVLRSFFAFPTSFTGGVLVAAGDVNGDGFADIITGRGAGTTQVKVFSGRNLALLKNFVAFTPSFPGGVRVAAGDVNGDGRADIITANGPAGHVKVFGGAGGLLRDFYATPIWPGSVMVGAGDFNRDGRADIVVGQDAGGRPLVRFFDGRTNGLIRQFEPYASSFRGGVRVAGADLNGDGRADLVTGTGPGGGAHVKLFSGPGSTLLSSFFAFTPSFGAGIFVAAG